MLDATAADPQQIIAELKRQLDERTVERDEFCAQRDEALERETATAEVLQVINSSPGDLAPVFDAILEKALGLCGAAFGILHTYDGAHVHTVAHRGLSREYAAFLSAAPHQPGTSGPIAAFLRREPFVHLDAAESQAYRERHPLACALVDLEGGRTLLAVPLRKDAALLGMFVIYRREVRLFSDKQIALLQNFAAQAVIAMENTRLITETREALEQQTATADVLQVINGSPGDLVPVFDVILEKAHSLCGAAFGTLLTFDGDLFRAAAVRGLPEAFGEMVRKPFRHTPNNPMMRLVHGEPLLHITDLAEIAKTAPDDSLAHAAVELGGVRTILAVPLRKDDLLLGVITAYRQEVRPFTDKQIALLQNFAAQAVIAMENARLITETREALDQQTATAEVLGVINSSPGDLAPVFDAMLDKALRLCEASFGIMNTYDGERIHRVAERGLPAAFSEWRQARPMDGSPGANPSSLQRLIGGESVIHTADLMTQDAHQAGDPNARAFVELAGARTRVAVALRSENTLRGMFTLFRQEVRPFTDKQIALLQNFAAQAVIAMENARLITETREALDQQTATAEVLGVINSSPGDLAPVFDAMLEKALRLCGGSFGSMTMAEPGWVRTVATRGVPAAFAKFREHNPAPANHPGIAGQLRAGDPYVHLLDLKDTDLYRNDDPQRRAIVELGGARTCIAVALRKDNEFLGGILIYRKEVRPFTDKQIALLQNFAAQAVIAMENARLITETHEALEQQTATAEVLGVITASPGDLPPVFDAILEKAHSLCGIALGELELNEGGKFRAVAVRGVSGPFAELLRQPFRPPPNSPLARLLAGERIVEIADVSALARQQPDDQRAQAGAQHGLRTALFVPLRKDDALLGYITAYRREVRPFSEKEIALLQNFAAQAVIAMENARLLGELHARTDEIAGWNRELEARVATQLAEIERTGKLRRFLAPQLADLILAQGDESILESHRREIVVVFCDLRGFTGFAERAEPEEVMALLRDYHAAMGPIVARFEGTIDHYGGDGIMVFFNDPLPTPDPARRAIDMAVAMRAAAQDLLRSWRRHGHDIGFGVGISQGYATLGQIGFAERMDYTAIGTVTNLAARLCGEAKDGQILVSRRVAIAVEDSATLEEIGDLSLKGLSQAIAVYNVVAAGAQASAS